MQPIDTRDVAFGSGDSSEHILFGGLSIGDDLGTGSGNLALTGSIIQSTAIAASVYNSATQNIPNITFTPMAFDTEVYDTDGIHDTVTNNTRLTCQTAGKYVMTGSVDASSNATGTRGIGIRLNGASIYGLTIVPASTGSGGRYLATVAILDLAATDYVELVAYQSSGGALTYIAGVTYGFAMQRIA